MQKWDVLVSIDQEMKRILTFRQFEIYIKTHRCGPLRHYQIRHFFPKVVKPSGIDDAGTLLRGLLVFLGSLSRGI